jgi:hypothetical protein
MITTEAMISEKPEKKKKPAMPQMPGDMYWLKWSSKRIEKAGH